ncbi:MAG: hypothetical protein ACJASM_003277 [Salibacteraceae bacterium]|jgi:hypothetical protein
MLQRLLYIGYYFKQLDWEKLKSFIDFAKKTTDKSGLKLFLGMLIDSYRYKISLLEYYQFGFYRGVSNSEKENWAGTGYMFEYQKVMNPLGKREILNDKTLFHKKYKDYFKHHVLDLAEMRLKPSSVQDMLKMPKVVLKESEGKCGLGTAFVDSKGYTPESIVSYMEQSGFDLAETYITQHPDLNRLSPSGVNTVRIFTQLNAKNEVEILGCRQRVSVNSPVDNLAAGNLAATIDEKTGIIVGAAVYSDITKAKEEFHPITKVEFAGFQIPFWQECLDLVKKAALEHPQNRSIGWDIVITSEGPGLIEGNHDWCKLVWQLPVNQGLKPILENHLKEYKKNEHIN